MRDTANTLHPVLPRFCRLVLLSRHHARALALLNEGEFTDEAIPVDPEKSQTHTLKFALCRPARTWRNHGAMTPTDGPEGRLVQETVSLIAAFCIYYGDQNKDQIIG